MARMQEANLTTEMTAKKEFIGISTAVFAKSLELVISYDLGICTVLQKYLADDCRIYIAHVCHECSSSSNLPSRIL